MPVKRFVFLCLLFFSLSFFGHLQEGFSQPPLPGHGESGDGVIGGLSQFEVIINDENVVAGQPFSITITARDMLENLIESFGGGVTISTDNTFGAGVTFTLEPFFEGSFTYNDVVLEQAVTSTISVTNAAAGESQSGTSVPFEVSGGTIQSFRIDEPPPGGKPGIQKSGGISTQRAGVPFNIRITALDAFGNVAEGFTGKAFLATNNSFESSVQTTTGNFVDGVAVHEVSLRNLSTNATISAENNDGQGSGISDPFEVIAGLPHSILITQPINGTIFILPGHPIEPFPIIILRDKFLNPISGEDVEVNLIKNGDDKDFYEGSTTMVTTNGSGEAIFSNLSIGVAGQNYQMVFSASQDETVTETSATFITVIPGAAFEMVIVEQPETSIAGQPISRPPQVKMQDNAGNGVPGENITVQLTGGGLVSGTYTRHTDSQGLVFFDDLIIEATGTYTLLFTTDAPNVDPLVSDPFEVKGAPLVRFVISTPGDAHIPDQVAGVEFLIKIVGYDEFDNVANLFNGTVDLTTTNVFGSTVSTTTSAFIGGVLDNYPVDLIIATSSNTITATNSDPDQNQSGISDAFDVTHAPLSKFELTLANGGKQAGDQTLLLPESNPGQNNAPSPFILKAQQRPAGGMLQAQNAWQNPFAQAAQAQDELLLLQSGNNRFSPQVVGADFYISITAFDEFDNIVLSFNSPVTLTTNNQFGIGVATETTAFSDGSLASHRVNLRIAAQTATITATYDGQSGTTEPFDVLPKPINIEVEDATRIYGDPNPQFSFKDFSSVLIDGDAMADITGGVGLASDVLYFTETDQESPVDVYLADIGIVTSSLNGSRAGSYSITVTNGELEIMRRDLVLTNFVADDKVYDGTTVVLSGDGFDDDRLFDDDLIFSYDVAFVDPNVAVGIDVNFSDIKISGGADIGNYSLTVTTATATATIFARTLTITVDDQFKANDDDPFPIDEYTVSYEGFAFGESPADLSGTLIFGGPAIDAIEIGVYTITSSGLSSSNYDIIYVDGFLTIGPRIPLALFSFLVVFALMLGFIFLRIKS